MRLILAAALAMLSVPVLADPTKSLLGKSDYDVVSCAGAPSQVMNFSGGRQIMSFVAEVSTGGVFFNGFGGATARRYDHSCTAMVHLKNGRVTKVEFQERGGIISRKQMCRRALKGCE